MLMRNTDGIVTCKDIFCDVIAFPILSRCPVVCNSKDYFNCQFFRYLPLRLYYADHGERHEACHREPYQTSVPLHLSSHSMAA